MLLQRTVDDFADAVAERDAPRPHDGCCEHHDRRGVESFARSHGNLSSSSNASLVVAVHREARENSDEDAGASRSQAAADGAEDQREVVPRRECRGDETRVGPEGRRRRSTETMHRLTLFLIEFFFYYNPNALMVETSKIPVAIKPLLFWNFSKAA